MRRDKSHSATAVTRVYSGLRRAGWNLKFIFRGRKALICTRSGSTYMSQVIVFSTPVWIVLQSKERSIMSLNCDRHSPLFTLHTRTCSHTRLPFLYQWTSWHRYIPDFPWFHHVAVACISSDGWQVFRLHPSGFSGSCCFYVMCGLGPSGDLVGTSRSSWGNRPDSQGIAGSHPGKELRQWGKEGKAQLQLTCLSYLHCGGASSGPYKVILYTQCALERNSSDHRGVQCLLCVLLSK